MLKIDCNIFKGSVLLAVSGGIDSVVMAHNMCHNNRASTPQPGGCPPRGDAQLPAAVPSGLGAFANAFRRDMAIAHCNFKLRGEESDGDEAFVKSFAAKLGVRCFVKSFDTESFARQNGISIEMAARELRYRWFHELCDAYGFEGVCVAHNANDNAETLILNLLRGTGLRGICGMKAESVNPFAPGDYPSTGTPQKGSKVFRPMLSFTRQEIEEYAFEYRLKWRTDSSNASDDYKRNIVRNRVFPLFEQINPSFVRTLNKDMENFRISSLTFEASQESLLPDSLRILNVRISSHSKEMRLGINWRSELADAMLDCGFNSSVIKDLFSLLESDRTKNGKTFYSTTHVLVIGADGIEIRPLAGVSASHLLFGEGSETVTPNIERISAIGDSDPAGKIRWEIPGLRVELIGWRPEMDPKVPRGVTLVDAGKLGREPVLRKWQDGDWMIPIGMRGRKKVSDILTELKYNVMDKKEVLVLEGEGSHVLAVVGERVDRSVMIDENTSSAYRISLK